MGMSYTGKYKTDYHSYVIAEVGPVIYSMMINEAVPNGTSLAKRIAPYIVIALLEKREDFEASIVGDNQYSGEFTATIGPDSVACQLHPPKRVPEETTLVYDEHD